MGNRHAHTHAHASASPSSHAPRPNQLSIPVGRGSRLSLPSPSLPTVPELPELPVHSCLVPRAAKDPPLQSATVPSPVPKHSCGIVDSYLRRRAQARVTRLILRELHRSHSQSRLLSLAGWLSRGTPRSQTKILPSCQRQFLSPPSCTYPLNESSLL